MTSNHLSKPKPKPKVVICRDLGPSVMPLLSHHNPNQPNDQGYEVVVWPENKLCDRKWLLENVRGATGVLVMLSEKVNEELLDAAGPSLKVVSTMSVGYEHVTLPELAKRGIRLGYTPDVLTDAVADLTVMLTLMVGRNVKETLEVVQSGQWPTFPWSPFAFCGPQLSTVSVSPSSSTPAAKPTRTVGFIGFGRIAQATLSRLIPFGITHCLFYTSSPPSPSQSSSDSHLRTEFPSITLSRSPSLSSLAQSSDIVIVLAPGGPSTYHIIDRAFLKEMKKTAILVNTSRGTLVDSQALKEALKEGWIYGAGLDVVEGEPDVGREHGLVGEPRCVVLPHIGSATFETRIGMATLAVDNLIAGVRGAEMRAEVVIGGGK